MTSESSRLSPASAGERKIVYMHIPKNWQQFYVEPHTTRKPRLCGTRGPSKYEGIPGITNQPLEWNDTPGWCIECIDGLFAFYVGNYKNIVTIPEVHEVYNIVFFEMLRFMRHCVENAERLGLPIERNGQNLT